MKAEKRICMISYFGCLERMNREILINLTMNADELKLKFSKSKEADIKVVLSKLWVINGR